MFYGIGEGEKHPAKSTMQKRKLKARRKAKRLQKARQIIALDEANKKTPAEIARETLISLENGVKTPQKQANLKGKGPRWKPVKNTLKNTPHKNTTSKTPMAETQKPETITASQKTETKSRTENRETKAGNRNEGSEENGESVAETLAPAGLVSPMCAKPQSWVPLFIAALRQMPVFTFAAKAAGITYSKAMDTRRKDPEFAKLCSVAIEQGEDMIEIAAIKRATVGWQESIYGRDAKGNPVKVGEKTLYSDRLCEVLLKGRKPTVYRERVSQELSGPGGAPIQPAATNVSVQIIIPSNGRESPEELKQIQAFQAQIQDKPTPPSDPDSTPLGSS